MIEKLADTFFSYSALNDDDNDNDDTKLAAGECLIAAKKILSLNLNQEAYIKALDILVPVFDFALVPKGGAFTEEATELLTEYLYNFNEIPPKLWKHFILLNYMLSGYPNDVSFIYDTPDALAQHVNPKDVDWGSEYIEQMVGAFQNYISKGKLVFLQEKEPGFGLSFIDLLVKSIDNIYELNKRHLEDDDGVYYMTTLYYCIIENCQGLIDNALVPIIQRCLLVLKMERVQKQRRLRRVLTQIV